MSFLYHLGVLLGSLTVVCVHEKELSGYQHASCRLEAIMCGQTFVQSTTYTKALCLTKKRPCLTVRLVLLLRSCVVLVTVAVSAPLESVSIRMRFLDSCSWHRMTFSVPCLTERYTLSRVTTLAAGLSTC